LACDVSTQAEKVGELPLPWKDRGAISYIGESCRVQLQMPIGRSATPRHMNRKNCIFSVHRWMKDSFFVEKTLERAEGMVGRLLSL
jgi:hypothetical protein